MSADLSPAKKAAMAHMTEMNSISAELDRKDAARKVKETEEAKKQKEKEAPAIVKYEVCSAAQSAELERLKGIIQDLTEELGTEHPRTLDCLNEFAELCFTTKKFEQAELFFRKAWEGRQRALTSYVVSNRPEPSPSIRTGLPGSTYRVFNKSIFMTEHRLAKTLEMLYRPKEAESLFKEALLGLEHIFQSQMHTELLECVDGYAVTLHKQGNQRFQDALDMYQRLLAMQRKLVGEMDPTTLSVLNRVAFVLRDMGNLKEAEAICVGSLDTCVKVLGNDHPTTQMSVEIVAFIRHSQGQSEEAEDMFRLALACNERLLGTGHPTTLGTVVKIGQLLSDQQLWAESEQMHRRALAGYESFYGSEHEDTVDEVQFVGELMLRAEVVAEAEALFRRALAARRNLYGESTPHPKSMDSAHCLAVLVQKQTKWKHDPRIHDRIAETELLYTTALHGRDQTLGPESDQSIESAACLAAFLFEEDRIEHAEVLWARVFKARIAKLGRLDLATAVAAFNLGIILQRQRRFFRGIEVFKVALDGFLRHYGTEGEGEGEGEGKEGGRGEGKEEGEGKYEFREDDGLGMKEHPCIEDARGAYENCLRMNAIS